MEGEGGDEQAVVKQRKQVLGHIHAGHISKAVNLVTSHGIASIRDEGVMEQLQLKFPPRNRPLPGSVTKGAPIDSFPYLRQTLLALQRGVSPGAGGLRNEFLVALAERMEDADMELLQSFIISYAAAELPLWFYSVWLSLQTVALFKTDRRDDVRPLGLRNSLVKVIHREVVRQSKAEIKEFLEPVQLGMSQAGAAKLVLSVGGAVRHRKDFVCCRIDLANAFNEISRASFIEVLEAEPSLSHLAGFAGLVLTPRVMLEAGGEVWGESEEGVAQGDPKSGAFFCLGLQPSLLQLNQECSVGGGFAKAGYDDCYAIGLPDVVMGAVKRFQRGIEERCGMRLQWHKTEWFS